MSQPEDNTDARISADRIMDAIADCFADCEQIPSKLIIYALCDLRHLCDREGLGFAEQDRAAHALYLEELSDPPR